MKHLSCLPSICYNDEDLKKLVLDDLQKVGFSSCGDVATHGRRSFLFLSNRPRQTRTSNLGPSLFLLGQ